MTVTAPASVIAHHRRLFAFDYWANLTALDAVEPVRDRVPKAIARLNHILGASRVWLSRVSGETAPFGLEASFDCAALRGEMAAANAGWTEFLAAAGDADLSRVITFRGTYRVSVADVLTHVPLHGQQHRGQINLDLRAAGIEPPLVDYVHAAGQGKF